MVKGVWNNFRGLQTTSGTFVSWYHPGAPNEYVIVQIPGGAQQNVPTPRLLDWFLGSEDGKLVVHYNRDDGDDKTYARVPTNIAAGNPTAWLVTGGTGPIGPAGPAGAKGDTGPQGPRGAAGAAGSDAVALTDDDLNRIALRVWTMPPPDGYKNISGVDLGTLAQEVTAYIWSKRQDFQQLNIQRIDEAVAFLVASGYQPKVG